MALNKLYKHIVRIKFNYYKLKQLFNFILKYHKQYKLLYYIIALYCKIKAIKYSSSISLSKISLILFMFLENINKFLA